MIVHVNVMRQLIRVPEKHDIACLAKQLFVNVHGAEQPRERP